MRLVYFGSGSFGLPALRALAAAHDVVLVVTQPDRPSGRHRRLAPTPVAEAASAARWPVLKTGDVNAPDPAEKIRGTRADAFVVIDFGQKLGERLVQGVLAVNLHASLLPRHRGAAPINWAIIAGDERTGVTVITLSPRIDAGDVVGQAETAIEPAETAGELEARLGGLGPALLLDVLARHAAGTLTPIPQDDAAATRAPKLHKRDGTVAFDRPAVAVRRRVHGLIPWPGCTVHLGGRPLKLIRVSVLDDAGRDAPPGTVLDDGTVACDPGRVALLEVQPPGGRPMPFADYLRGRPAAGQRLEPA